jgi:hypothetical protein
MESDRIFAGIESSMENADGQTLQHFMSNSPWSGQGVFKQIRDEIIEKPGLHPGSLPSVGLKLKTTRHYTPSAQI